jgi:dihydropteroate synthase
VKEFDVPISIDTRKAAVAEAAIDAGAVIVNDIWGLRGDKNMAGVVARHPHTALVAMHNQRGTSYQNLIEDILARLSDSISLAERHGIAANRIMVDPGFGFGKTPIQNVEIVRRLREFRALGRPVLIGISRKSTVGAILGGAPVEERLEAALALTALAVEHGADIVRTNDVEATARACRATDEVVRGPSESLMSQRSPGRTL